MKFFEEPKLEVKAFATEDIINASGGFQPGEDETEEGGGL